MKFLVLLRDPTDRLVSDYHHELNAGRIPGNVSFAKYVLNSSGELQTDLEMVHTSIYVQHLKRWFRYFPRNQFLILDSSELVHNPATVLQQVEHFLHVPNRIKPRNFVFVQSKGFYCKRKTLTDNIKCMGDNKGIKHNPVSPDTLAKIRQYYEPYNQELYKLIHKKFSWMSITA